MSKEVIRLILQMAFFVLAWIVLIFHRSIEPTLAMFLLAVAAVGTIGVMMSLILDWCRRVR